MQYWYSAQLRQYRLQFIRAFSNFYVETGAGGPNNTVERIRVPCRYGDPSRIAASIVRGNSENKLLAVPFITCYINGLAMASSRRQDPQHVSKLQVNERLYDTEKAAYTNQIGNRYTVERYMPVPYDLTMQVDIWTNNLDTKEQLLEQIFVLYNPAIDIQTSVNPIDWTVLTYIEMQDNISWSSRSIPVGTDNPIEVATLQFKVPIWISPPAKVKKQAIIQEIVTNIVQGYKEPLATEWTEYEFFSRTITTPGNAVIKVKNENASTYSFTLCDESGSNVDKEHLPTITNSRSNIDLSTTLSFLWNGLVCNITSSSINDAVADIRRSLTNSNLNCVVFNENQIQFINTDGGDNVFEEITAGGLSRLGLQAATYPGGTLSWWRLLELYGTVKAYSNYGTNASQIRLKTLEDIEQTNTDIVGWIEIDSIDQNKLLWHADPESFPQTTLGAIDAIIDPQSSGPGVNLPNAMIGVRYLLTNDASNQSAAWGTLSAKENDIIEFDGSTWNTVWTPANNNNTTQYVLNLRSNQVYRWLNGYWARVIESKYAQGYWRLAL